LALPKHCKVGHCDLSSRSCRANLRNDIRTPKHVSTTQESYALLLKRRVRKSRGFSGAWFHLHLEAGFGE
jgi:hypothetical protein